MFSIKHWKQKALVLVIASLTPPAIAGLIYDWYEDPDMGSTATGFIEFSDSVVLGDIVDPLTGITTFSFSNAVLPDWSMSDYLDSDYLELGTYLDLTLTPPPGTTKKKAAKKTDYFELSRDDALLSFTTNVKKKAAKKTALPPPIYWAWDSSGTVIYDGGDSKKKKKTYVTDAGIGYWALRNGQVPVPEPSSLLLFLIGIAAVSAGIRQIRRRAR